MQLAIAAVNVVSRFIPKGSVGKRSTGSDSTSSSSSSSSSSHHSEFTPQDDRGEASSDRHPQPSIIPAQSSVTRSERDEQFSAIASNTFHYLPLSLALSISFFSFFSFFFFFFF
jgi:hypothetical protein